jgi:hypothetical protein
MEGWYGGFERGTALLDALERQAEAKGKMSIYREPPPGEVGPTPEELGVPPVSEPPMAGVSLTETARAGLASRQFDPSDIPEWGGVRVGGESLLTRGQVEADLGARDLLRRRAEARLADIEQAERFRPQPEDVLAAAKERAEMARYRVLEEDPFAEVRARGEAQERVAGAPARAMAEATEKREAAIQQQIDQWRQEAAARVIARHAQDPRFIERQRTNPELNRQFILQQIEMDPEYRARISALNIARSRLTQREDIY